MTPFMHIVRTKKETFARQARLCPVNRIGSNHAYAIAAQLGILCPVHKRKQET